MATKKLTHKVRNPLDKTKWMDIWTVTTTATSTATGSTAATYKIEPSENWDIPSNQIKITGTPGVVITNNNDGHITTLPFSSSSAVYLDGQGNWSDVRQSINISGSNGLSVSYDNNKWEIIHSEWTDSTSSPIDSDESNLFFAPYLIDDGSEVVPPTASGIVSDIIAVPLIKYDNWGHIRYATTIDYDLSDFISTKELTVENGILYYN